MPPADTPQSTFHVPEGFEAPPGFVVGTISDDNMPYLLPISMVPTLERVVAEKRAKSAPEIAKASGKVLGRTRYKYQWLTTFSRPCYNLSSMS